MAEHLEIEYKNILTKEEFHAIQAHFSVKDDEFILQENDYFDTPTFSLKKLGCALRIRKKSGQYEFTLKEPQETGLLETNESVTEEERHMFIHDHIFPIGEISQKLKLRSIDTEQVRYFGTLKTYRKEVPYLGGTLVMDKSYYFNKEDFELEYEVVDPVIGKKNFVNVLTSFQIPIRKTMNKVQRFYQEMQKQETNI